MSSIDHKMILRTILARLGYTVTRAPVRADMEHDFWRIYDLCHRYTRTPLDRMYALYKAVQYVVDSDLPGDFVECGVWRGGSAMLIAATLMSMCSMDRTIYLYDTFTGMTPPTNKDRDYENLSAHQLLARSEKTALSAWAIAPLDDVRRNMALIRYPEHRLRFVQGRVEDTIPSTAPERIALLRLDTDWYESTHHELVHLFPRLAQHGVLILDDYGHWQGARDAADQYLRENAVRMLLHRIDYSARIAIKQ